MLAIGLSGCKDSIHTITKASDYDKYMHLASADTMPSLKSINTDITFWSKRLAKNPEDAVAKVSLAGLYGTRFKTTGDINDVHTADSLYLVANSLFKTCIGGVLHQ